MPGWLRRAGHGTMPDGSRYVWSIAEGSRGRRWREVACDGSGTITSSLLLETDPERHFSHAELTTRAGLLTLHPEPDGSLHGNVITSAGIEHVRGLPWAPDGILSIEHSVLSLAAAGWLLARADDPERPRSWVSITASLACRSVEQLINHETFRAYADGDGLPRLDAAESWPLEE